ncbi:hypothetical protein FOA52_001493 [Chlamydomonas sp. UWO 241]|nr:hypothetical protein FOA52_001493 [Chlamydomonas sp. UWO 241]
MHTAPVVDLALIHRLTNLNEITRILHETIAKERAVDVELDQLLSKRAELERSFLLLNTPTAETLELVHADCEQLLLGVQGTSQLATHISTKVRTLDLAQSRVTETLEKIKAILDRTNCINGVQAAMDAEDYEAAAAYIGTFFDLESKMTHHNGQLAVDDGEDAQRQVLLQARSKLESVVDRQLDDAVARRDATAVLRFARLYKPLSKQAEGLRRFVEWVRLGVAGRARSAYSALSESLDSSKKVDFNTSLSLLFKDLATALSEHEAFVGEVFGPAGVLALVAGLHAEADVHGTQLLGRFSEARRVDSVVASVRSRKGGSARDAGGPDVRIVDVTLQELLRLCQLAEEYNQFMLSKMRSEAAGGQLTAAREAAFRSAPFNVSLKELLAAYQALEEFYMDETVAMSLRIDEVSPGQLTSSLVDDVFFILRKCGMRALASGSPSAAAPLLAELDNLIGNVLRDALSARLAPGPARLLVAAPEPGAASGGGSDALMDSGDRPAEHCVALNNADVCAEYVGKLRTELDGYLASAVLTSGERERVRSSLGDLAKSASVLKQMHTKALEQVAEAAIPKLRPLLDEVAAASYQLTDAGYSAREVEDGWAQRLLGAVGSLMMWLQPQLTTTSYEVLFHTLLDKLLTRLEALLGRKQFSQLGGLQLERDARQLLAGFQELSSRTVRDKVSRLSQMALLLGLETVDEVLDYWSAPGSGGGGGGEGGSSGGITWRLSGGEVRAALLQRSDFSRDAVMALPL